MKKSVLFFATIVALSVLSLHANAQNEKCSLDGYWYVNQLGGNWGEASCTIFADKKVGQNPHMAKRPSNGYISIADVYFENERIYNLVFSKTLTAGTYEFTVQYFIGKQLKTGRLQIKTIGNKIAISALDPVTKKQPIHGKIFEAAKQ